MTMCCLDINEHGQIKQIRRGAFLEPLPGYGCVNLDGDVPANIDAMRVDVDTLELVALPEKPSRHHVFDYQALQWIDPRTPDTEWPLVRDKRDRLIAATDWTQLPDVPLATKEMWANYRQALRDVTLQADPFNIVWPTAPQ